MAVTAPTLLHPPAVLGQVDGLTILHWGVIHGPHGVSLVIEVVDTAGSGALDRGQWRDPTIDLLTVTTHTNTGENITPKLMARTGGPGWQQWTIMFDRHDRVHRVDPRRVKLVVHVRPIDWTATIPAAN